MNEKIDVYSFGVILLELATGREPGEGDEHTSLAEWAWRHAQEGKPIADTLDQDVKEPCYLDEMTAVFKLGIMCTEKLPSNRPSMQEMLHILVRTCPRPVQRENTEGGVLYLNFYVLKIFVNFKRSIRICNRIF